MKIKCFAGGRIDQTIMDRENDYRDMKQWISTSVDLSPVHVLNATGTHRSSTNQMGDL